MHRSGTFLIIAVAASMGIATAPCAGEIADAATAVEVAISAQDFDAFYAANETLLETAWAAAGLYFGTVDLATAPSSGYGIYSSRDSNVFAVNEPIHIYSEPRGYGFGDLPDGQHELAFDIDLKVMDGSGTVLGEVPDFAVLSVASKNKPREFSANVEVTLTDAPPGDYKLELTFRDRYSDGVASFPVDVKIQ